MMAMMMNMAKVLKRQLDPPLLFLAWLWPEAENAFTLDLPSDDSNDDKDGESFEEVAWLSSFCFLAWLWLDAEEAVTLDVSSDDSNVDDDVHGGILEEDTWLSPLRFLVWLWQK